ncbi:MAG: molybdenum cofactor guanylyltransferase [Anaerolineae bacterium]|nr:MAG: molybdenum cofactor guanylyltransferase [Anaerolineae bacterium]
MKDLSVVIQAGGQSRRMGTDKALVSFGGVTLVEYVLMQLSGWGEETLIISNNPEFPDLGVPVVRDVIQGVGALGGLHTALVHARFDKVMLLAVDMPFVHRPLMEHLTGLVENYDAVIPRWQDEEYAEPFRAVYKRTCLEPVAEALGRGERRMISFYPQVAVRLVEPGEVAEFDPKGWTFTNANTPEELAAAEALRPEFERAQAGWG